MTDIEQTLDAALREARNEALEEAARVCEEMALPREHMPIDEAAQATAAYILAVRIRALKSQEAG